MAIWGKTLVWQLLISFMGFPGGSDSKESVCSVGDQSLSPGLGKIPWMRKWQPISVFLPGKPHGQSSLGGYRPWGCKELGMTERL